jgi:hypothetical protein
LNKDKEIEIVIAGKTFVAELLWKDAPTTCKLIYDTLPIDYSKVKWWDPEYLAIPIGKATLVEYLSAPHKNPRANHTGLGHTGYAGFCMITDTSRNEASWTAPPENQKFVLQAGDCTWKTYQPPIYKPMFHQELYVCYRPTTLLGYRGVNLCNNFARITENLDELAAIGEELFSNPGRKTILLRKKQ